MGEVVEVNAFVATANGNVGIKIWLYAGTSVYPILLMLKFIHE